jgi:leucyl aminopeptidase (aminopeptidase T)
VNIMTAEMPCSLHRARAYRSLLLLTGPVLFLAGCDRPENAAGGAETAAVSGAAAVSDAVAGTGAGTAADLKSVAAKVVQQSAGVRGGDIVLVAGSDADLPLLEDIAIEVRKVGGQALVTVNTDGFNRRSYDEVPAKYDGQAPELTMKLVEMVDVFINTDAGDGRTMKGVAPERMAARGKAFAPVGQAMRKRGVRTVALGNGLYPSAERAEQFGMSREELAGLMYGGIDADYAQLQATGARLRTVLAAGKEIRITAPGGTDLRVKIAGRPVVVSDGVISAEDQKQGGPAVSAWLPAGEVFLTPVPGTANGAIVADHMFYQGDRIEGLRLEVKDGKVVGMTARSGLDQLKEYYQLAGPGKDLLSVVDIGINPSVQLPEGGAVNVWSRAGAVTVVVGDNSWAGGDNRVNFAIPPEIRNATLEVDGTALVKDGKITGGTAVAGR